MRKSLFLSLLLSVSCFAMGEEPLADYQPNQRVSGNLSSMGSDTFGSLVTLWAEAFSHINPAVNIQVQATGSSTAAPALTEGTAQLGPMSRAMRMREIEAFERRHGYKPTELKVAIDAIGIFVHKDNPIQGLNFQQIDSIFSATLRCGADSGVDTWQQLGIKQTWGKRRMVMFGRNSVSGTYGFFKQNALCNGDFKRNVNEQPGSASVVQSVASSVNSIGYSGVGFQVSDAKLLPIAKRGEHYVEATQANIISGKYPLSRYLYIYVNKHPIKPLSRLESEFLRFVFSKQGQEMVAREGYVPISSQLASQELAKVGLTP
ncbi:phosphate ABC transporter substrate-binding protein PstS family protein [Vibrio sp. SCSIO 43136]|uniref:PstS family phosphate ABC transporter substrate-binding protein n=1 Tax=Vibrio sp. SCSIO 43136 TaxID=2819101 RepID=UPI00218A414F|nr:phosphate ABC transporter substrate-binding protein PstS family protein [Vibrio sp. SCSIO 43136]USD65766.1 phosphate ABC transporter substrate-binding protein PstS family protein [Vibrio sp. SCSIO 43136]